MLKRLLAVFSLVLISAAASAQPNLAYNCVRDNQQRPVFCTGVRPTVTAEMGIPPGTPFFSTSDYSLYYWSGSAWTGAASAGSTFTGPLLISDGTVGTPSLAFASNSDVGWYATVDGWRLSVNGGLIFTLGGSGPIIQSDAAFLRFGASADLTLSREAAASLQMGQDAATATAQTFKGADSTGNGTAGGILTIRAGAGTAGDAKGGNLNLIGGDNAGAGEEGVVVIVDGGTKPTCSAANRGAFWYDQGGAGVADTFEICAKSAADAYAWRSTSVLIP